MNITQKILLAFLIMPFMLQAASAEPASAAMAASSSSAAAMPEEADGALIKLQSQKGHVFQVPQTIATKYFGLLKNFLSPEVMKMESTNLEKPIELKDITTADFETVLRFATLAERLSRKGLEGQELVKKMAEIELDDQYQEPAKFAHLILSLYFLDANLIKEALLYKLTHLPAEEFNSLIDGIQETALPPLIKNNLTKSNLAKQWWLTHNKTLPENLKDADFGVSIQDLINHKLVPEYTTSLELVNYKINSLEGLKKLPNIANLQRLTLYGNPLTEIPEDAFVTLKNLRNLSLGGSKLTAVPVDALAHLTELTTLSLFDNQFTEVPVNAFTKLTNLRNLSLSNNRLHTVPPKALAGLTNLRTLRLDNNLLTNIDKKVFSDLANLYELILDNNQLGETAMEQISNALPNVDIVFGEQRKPEPAASSSAHHPEDSSSAAGGGASSSSAQ